MTNTPTLKVITCLYEDGRAQQCGSLVEDTDSARRAHRAWHADDKKVKDAIRSENRHLRAELDELKLRLADTQRDVETFEVPAPVIPIEVNAGGWSDEDEPDDFADTTTNVGLDDDVTSVYADEHVNATVALDPADLPPVRIPAGHDLT